MTQPYTFTNRVGARPIPREHMPATVDELFQLGYDTFDIAARFHISEPEALRLVTALRSERLGFDRPARMSA